ncbi:response regulator transcription factor [Thalassococcus sp. S3]|uniref:LuxR C-terminal-related transcriptional regulator n=1 Tax=Thalassococcus sp. S3 TaxID=2017482 RepID=UPI0010247E69|nr:response regulator transcription factor [Thalassococcus sp. S3]QBF30605.1 DNA-binding response regulator [Thalassococcus sp. S3]
MSDTCITTDETVFRTALIVDDHPLFCDALSMTLQAVADIEDIRTAANLEYALGEIEAHGPPDIIVLDLNLPDVNGLDGLIRLKTAARVPVMVVSSMADNRVITGTINAGAAGFVPKHSQREVFRNAIQTLRRGEVFIPDGAVLLQQAEVANATTDAVARMGTLTNQQSRILQLICEGKLNKQIAYELSIAETTVKAHVTAIMRKLGVQSRTQAVLIAKETSFANVLSDTP